MPETPSFELMHVYSCRTIGSRVYSFQLHTLWEYYIPEQDYLLPLYSVLYKRGYRSSSFPTIIVSEKLEKHRNTRLGIVHVRYTFWPILIKLPLLNPYILLSWYFIGTSILLSFGTLILLSILLSWYLISTPPILLSWYCANIIWFY